VRDTSKPDGTPRKLMLADKLRGLGWAPSVGMLQGVTETYSSYLKTIAV